MAIVTPARLDIQQEEVAYKSAVSEAVGGKIAASINFINEYQVKQFHMGVTGDFEYVTTPYLDIGAQEVFETDSEIENVFIRYGAAGSAGTSELDIKWAADNSGTFATIFSTTPKVANTAADDGVFDANGISTTPSGCTQPVLSKTTFAAGDKIRCDIIDTATGCNTFVIVITFRPI